MGAGGPGREEEAPRNAGTLRGFHLLSVALARLPVSVVPAAGWTERAAPWAAQPRSPADAPFRCVWIEKESINSVIISDAPEDLHQRMLVAASLSVNATGEWGCVHLPRALLPAPLCYQEWFVP